MSSDSSSENSEGSRISLVSWLPVAFWYPDLLTDSCAICRNLIMDVCVSCQHGEVGHSLLTCTISVGSCDHAFHKHCISRWLSSKNVCPLDSKPWSYVDEHDTTN